LDAEALPMERSQGMASGNTGFQAGKSFKFGQSQMTNSWYLSAMPRTSSTCPIARNGPLFRRLSIVTSL
jgi:hypothetical protein